MNGTLADRLRGKHRLCIDTMVFIYYVEANPTYLPMIEPVFRQVTDAGLAIISSYLTLLEVLVQPLKLGRKDIAEQYREILLNTNGLQLIPLDRVTAERAAEIKAAHGFRTPDAIQLAAALAGGADAFLTNDRRLRTYNAVEIFWLDDFQPRP
jgi:predicted nucleic acid-binding protein